MPEAEDELDAVRRELSRLARRKDARVIVWSPQMPSEWTPGKINNPQVDMPFTEAGAWHFFADLLDCGHPIRRVALKRPPGEEAFEMSVDLKPGMPRLYIKVQLKYGKIIGRSFHYSDRETTPLKRELRP
jgi:hypothetical protein